MEYFQSALQGDKIKDMHNVAVISQKYCSAGEVEAKLARSLLDVGRRNVTVLL